MQLQCKQPSVVTVCVSSVYPGGGGWGLKAETGLCNKRRVLVGEKRDRRGSREGSCCTAIVQVGNSSTAEGLSSSLGSKWLRG